VRATAAAHSLWRSSLSLSLCLSRSLGGRSNVCGLPAQAELDAFMAEAPARPAAATASRPAAVRATPPKAAVAAAVAEDEDGVGDSDPPLRAVPPPTKSPAAKGKALPSPPKPKAPKPTVPAPTDAAAMLAQLDQHDGMEADVTEADLNNPDLLVRVRHPPPPPADPPPTPLRPRTAAHRVRGCRGQWVYVRVRVRVGGW
jgi:hypothetical protein